MAHVKVDIKHPSGEVQLGHVVELGAHSRRTIAEQVEDHLRLRHTKKGVRGGWTYENVREHVPGSAKPAPKANA
jgi:hypothetical protein